MKMNAVIPAQAGIQGFGQGAVRRWMREPWVPAFAGMTGANQ
jgi:hypothetical protein